MKTINLKYDIGDVVKYKTTEDEYKYAVCEFCGGTGRVWGVNNTSANCPRCGGNTEILKDIVKKEVIKEGTIERWCVNSYNKEEPHYIMLRNKAKLIKESDIIEKVNGDGEE